MVFNLRNNVKYLPKKTTVYEIIIQFYCQFEKKVFMITAQNNQDAIE